MVEAYTTRLRLPRDLGLYYIEELKNENVGERERKRESTKMRVKWVFAE